MSIKVYKPTSNSRRNMSVTDYSELSKVAPERSSSSRSRINRDETTTVALQYVTAAAQTAESTV